MTPEQYKIPLLMIAGLTVMGGLAWWFMRTELPTREEVIPVERVFPAKSGKAAPTFPTAKPKAVPQDLKLLHVEALLAVGLKGGRGREQERAAVVAEICRRQAQAAVMDTLAAGEGGKLRPFTAELLKTWGAADHEAALAWWRGLGKGKELLAQPLVDGCLMGGGKEGAAFYFALGAGERMLLNKELTGAVQDAGGAEALDALFAIQDPDRTKEALAARRDLLRRATDALRGKAGPEMTAAWLQKYAAEPFAYGAAFDTLVSAWAQKDAPAAAAWAVELPANPHLWGDPLGLPRAVKEWAKRDISAATQWADQQSGHRNYDILAETIAEVLAKDDAKAAAAWLESIRGVKRRDEARQRLGLIAK